MLFAKQNGLVFEVSYAYTEKQGNCKQNQGGYKIANVKEIKGCGALRKAVRKAPVVVSISATGW